MKAAGIDLKVHTKSKATKLHEDLILFLSLKLAKN